MNTPRRWLEEPGSSTHIERDLLRSALGVEPPPGAQATVWAALITRIPPLPPGGAGGSAAPGVKAAGVKAAGAAGAAGAVGGGILKSALIGAGSAVALIAAYTAVTPSKLDVTPAPIVHSAEAPSARAAARAGTRQPTAPMADATATPAGAHPEGAASPAAPAAPAPSTSAAEPQDTSAGAAAPPLPKDPTTGNAPLLEAEPAAAADRQSRLLEESGRLTEARNTLRRGDAAGTIALLEELGRQFPGGGLGQEREALMIEALYTSGRRAAAIARAEAFLKAYPTSPHAPKVQAFTK